MPDGEGNRQGYYIYCIIRTDQDRVFPVSPIDGDGREVGTIRFMDLAAVVSPTEQTRYRVTRQHVLAHQLVTEHIMQQFTLLPVRFGTVAGSSEDVVEKLLKRKFGEFHGLLNYLEDKAEMGVKALWKREALFGQILAGSPNIRQLRDRLEGRSEAESRQERIRLGQMVEQALEAKREEDSALLLDALRPLSTDTKVNKPVLDNMVLNASFLVPVPNQPLFDAKMSELDQNYSGQMLFKYVGPVPPYNFVNVAVSWD